MWNPKDDDDSWEVRAFEEDTGNSMGATWPPRFYTCTFCRREFRSAQALGGHMNVHRRDRVRLNQTPSNTSLTTFPNANSNLLVQNQEFLPNGGLCLVYSSMPNYNLNYGTNKSSSTVDSPSNNLFSNTISPFLMMSSPSSNFHVNQQPHNNNNNIISSSSSNNSTSNDNNRDNGKDEIDLELRLGWRAISNTTKMTGYKV